MSDTRAVVADACAIAACTWREVLTPPLSGAENMAADVALMDRARKTGEAVLRIYTWREPTLSFGRNQSTAAYDRASLRAAGIGIVRRPTGGRAILHHREITYSVTARMPDEEPISVSYDWINSLIVDALRSLGVSAAVSERSERAPAPDASPCFSTATPGEITAHGRKLVGSAQYREAGAMLQHGSILVADDQSCLSALGGTPEITPPGTLGELLGRTARAEELYDAMRTAMIERSIDSAALAAEDVLAGAEPYVATFADPQWTWRR